MRRGKKIRLRRVPDYSDEQVVAEVLKVTRGSADILYRLVMDTKAALRELGDRTWLDELDAHADRILDWKYDQDAPDKALAEQTEQRIPTEPLPPAEPRLDAKLRALQKSGDADDVLCVRGVTDEARAGAARLIRRKEIARRFGEKPLTQAQLDRLVGEILSRCKRGDARYFEVSRSKKLRGFCFLGVSAD